MTASGRSFAGDAGLAGGAAGRLQRALLFREALRCEMDAPLASAIGRLRGPQFRDVALLTADANNVMFASREHVGGGEGQLSVAAEAPVEVLDEGDAFWFLVRDIVTGQIGYVPVSILQSQEERQAQINSGYNKRITAPSKGGDGPRPSDKACLGAGPTRHCKSVSFSPQDPIEYVAAELSVASLEGEVLACHASASHESGPQGALDGGHPREESLDGLAEPWGAPVGPAKERTDDGLPLMHPKADGRMAPARAARDHVASSVSRFFRSLQGRPVRRGEGKDGKVEGKDGHGDDKDGRGDGRDGRGDGRDGRGARVRGKSGVPAAAPLEGRAKKGTAIADQSIRVYTGNFAPQSGGEGEHVLLTVDESSTMDSVLHEAYVRFFAEAEDDHYDYVLSLVHFESHELLDIDGQYTVARAAELAKAMTLLEPSYSAETVASLHKASKGARKRHARVMKKCAGVLQRPLEGAQGLHVASSQLNRHVMQSIKRDRTTDFVTHYKFVLNRWLGRRKESVPFFVQVDVLWGSLHRSERKALRSQLWRPSLEGDADGEEGGARHIQVATSMTVAEVTEAACRALLLNTRMDELSFALYLCPPASTRRICLSDRPSMCIGRIADILPRIDQSAYSLIVKPTMRLQRPG